jgi:CTP synthase
VNPSYHAILRQHGLVFSGMSPDERLVEIIELPGHPFFMAGQFHPELRSRPGPSHPLFREFIGAALARRRGEVPPTERGDGAVPLPEREAEPTAATLTG